MSVCFTQKGPKGDQKTSGGVSLLPTSPETSVETEFVMPTALLYCFVRIITTPTTFTTNQTLEDVFLCVFLCLRMSSES